MARFLTCLINAEPDIKSLLASPGDKRTPKLTNVGASNDDLGHPQAASLRHGEDGATSATCFFSAQFEEPVVTRAAQNQITKPVTLPLMPPFAASLFLQLPSSQLDMAEACGSRTHNLS